MAGQEADLISTIVDYALHGLSIQGQEADLISTIVDIVWDASWMGDGLGSRFNFYYCRCQRIIL